jgi:O-antigen/teichoic acid export membrane protein
MILAAPQAMLKTLLRDDLLRRMLRNASYLVTGTAGGSFLALIALALTARALGPELLGILAMIQAFAGMVDRARIETSPALIKYGAEALEEERYEDFKGLIKFGFLVDVASALFATMVAMAAVLAASWWFDWAPETTQMAGLFSLSILFRTSSMPTAVLRLFNRFGLDAVQDVSTNAARVLLVGIAYLAGAGLWTFLLITMAAQILNSVVLTIVGWTVLRRQGYRGVLTSSCKGIRQRCPGIWSFIWSLNASNIARRSTREVDVLFVGGVLDPAAASLYHIAKKLGEILVLVGTPLQNAVYPELARLWARAEASRFRRTVTQIDLGAGCLGVAFLMVVAFNADLLITLTMGAEFTAAAVPLVLQTLGVVLFLFGTALRPALFSMGMQVRLLQIVTLSTICFYVTLPIAVYSFGLYGAPLAHIAYNLVWLVAMRAAFVEGVRQGPAGQDGASVPGAAVAAGMSDGPGANGG